MNRLLSRSCWIILDADDPNVPDIRAGPLVREDDSIYNSLFTVDVGTRDPASFTIKYNTTGDPILAATLANPLPYQHFSGSSVITSSGTSFSLYFNTSGTGGAGAVNYYITRFKVTIVSV